MSAHIIFYFCICFHNFKVYFLGIYCTSSWLPLQLADPPVAMLPCWILITVESDSWLVTPFYTSHTKVTTTSDVLYNYYKDNNYKDIITICLSLARLAWTKYRREKRGGYKDCLKLLCCSCSVQLSIVMNDNIPHCLFWIEDLNYSTHSTFGRRLYCSRHVYGLTTRSELTSVMCCDRWPY